METSKSSTRQLTLDELISSQEDFPANPTHSQESEWARKTNATCGPKCVESFGKFSRVGSWAKTFAALLVGMEGWSSTRCKLTWKLKGTKSHRMYFQLQPSVRPTAGIESGLLLTPTTREEVMDQEKFKARMEKYDNGTTVPNLATQVVGMLPTPTAFDYNTPRSQEAWDKAKEKHGDALQNPLKQMAAFGMLPTPIAGDWKGQRRVGRDGLNVEREGIPGNASDTFGPRERQNNRQGKPRQSDQTRPISNWQDFPTVSPVCGGDDGLPKELDGLTFPKWRRESIKAYGNAIVPQVALQIFKTIKAYEDGT